MGTIECCELTDPQLHVSLKEMRGFMLGDPRGYSQLATEFQLYRTKAKLYGDMFMKKAEGRNQFILQVFSSNRGSEVVNVPMRVYTDAVEHAQQKKLLTLDTPVSDPNQTHQQFFLGQQGGNRFLYKLVSFCRYEQEAFKRIVYQLFMHRKVSQLKCPQLHTLFEQYVIESGIDKEANDKCCVVVAEHGMATLHEIVTYRKQANWNWTESEFMGLMNNMIQAMAALHTNKIVHRDIRPHNIMYSGYKGSYVLTGFRLSKVLTRKQNETHAVVGVPYYANPELRAFMKDETFADFASYNCCDSDIYALGVTLATAFFLELTLPQNMILPALTKYQKQYPFLQLIIQMVSPNPPGISMFLQNINPVNGQRKLSEENLIETLRYKSKPQDEQFVSHRRAIADGYYHMFMYGHWAIEINEVVSYYELKRDKVQLAEVYKVMGDIYSEHHQQQCTILGDSAIQEYYGKASKLFSDIGQDCIHEKRIEQGIKYLERGIQCNRKANRGIENYELALLLNRLAMAHHQKSEYEVAKAFQEEALEMTGKTKSQNSIEFAKMALDAAKIESEFLNLKQADVQLKASLRILDARPQDNEALRIKAMVLEALGNNYRMKAIERKHKVAEYREKAEHCILDALEICERLKGNGDIQIASILMSLGNVYFDKRDFHNAKKTYERSLIIKKNVLPADALEIGEALTYLANCYKSLKEYNDAIKHYDEAIEVFRACYGNDHNHNTAVAIGNIGLVYKDLGKVKEAREYLNLGKKILKDLYGEECPDYQYFNQQL